MDTGRPLNPTRPRKLYLVLILCMLILIRAAGVASLVQTDFGRFKASNVTYKNFNGISIRAKLLHRIDITSDNYGPGLVYIHGYPNNRETGDADSIELARRGFVVLYLNALPYLRLRLNVIAREWNDRSNLIRI